MRDSNTMGSRNSESSDLSDVTNFLSNNGAIRLQHYCRMNPRFVNLNTHDIFRALVSLYEIFFQSRWRSLKHLVDSITLPPPFTSPQSYIATVYISHWFIDLHVSIREAINKQTYLSISEPFIHNEYCHSRKYDCFLVKLNAHVHPTHIKLTPEDSLYVPLISSDEPDFNNKENPFGIDGFKLDCTFFEVLVWTLEDQKVCKMVELSDETMGKPSWLLDWHQSGVFTWFPQQGNYSLEDITVAYVLGVACTPNLGMKDVDEWQYIPDQKFSETSVDPKMYNRVTSRTHYGTRKVRSVEVEEWIIPENLKNFYISRGDGSESMKKKQRTNGSGADTTKSDLSLQFGREVDENEALLNSMTRVRLVDWLYHSQVIFCSSDESRFVALRRILSPSSEIEFFGW